MEKNMERKQIQTLRISSMYLGHLTMGQTTHLKANGHWSQHPALCLVDQVCHQKPNQKYQTKWSSYTHVIYFKM